MSEVKKYIAVAGALLVVPLTTILVLRTPTEPDARVAAIGPAAIDRTAAPAVVASPAPDPIRKLDENRRAVAVAAARTEAPTTRPELGLERDTALEPLSERDESLRRSEPTDVGRPAGTGAGAAARC